LEENQVHFGTNGIVTNSVPAGTGGLEGVVIQPADGKIVTVGTANNLTELTVSRYLASLAASLDR
jgi:hypothetical protein